MVDPIGPYLLGLDGGTEGMRVGIFTTDGTPVIFVREAYATTHPRTGWAEQDPQDWWDAAVRAVRRAVAESGIDPNAVAGLALACTSCSLVFADSDGKPLRSAIIWMDVRSSAEAAAVRDSGDTALRYSGGVHASAEWLPCKALWVKRHQPEVWERTAWVAEYVDWMGFRLTGERAASLNTAAIRAYYDRLRGGWATSLYEAIGLDDVTDKLPGRVLAMGELLGGLSAAAAAELGLPQGLLVAEGGADAFVGQIGLGIVEPGGLALITGSSHLQLLQVSAPSYAPGLFGSYTDAVIPGQFTVEGGQSSTGSIVNWLGKICASASTGGSGPGRTSTFLQEMNVLAHTLPPGSDGIIALPHWQGNRTPYVDGDLRGVFLGLSLAHGPQHLFRAVLEGICYGTEDVLRTMRMQGHQITDVVACGGALNSPLWMQLHANVSGIPVRTTKVGEAVSLGAAVLAAAAAELYPSVPAAAAAMTHTADVIEPDADAHEEYTFYVDQYLQAHHATEALLHRLVQRQHRDRRRPLQAVSERPSDPL